jgi:hypothetical protein
VYAPAPAPQEPPVYVERNPAPRPAPQDATAPPSWWYYCESAGAYYPDVQSCPEPWRKVAPQPE